MMMYVWMNMQLMYGRRRYGCKVESEMWPNVPTWVSCWGSKTLISSSERYGVIDIEWTTLLAGSMLSGAVFMVGTGLVWEIIVSQVFGGLVGTVVLLEVIKLLFLI